MPRSIATTLALTAAAAGAITLSSAFVPGAATDAEARRFAFVKGHHHLVFRPRYVVPRIAFVATTHVSGCHYLKRRAHISGSPYVWNRYLACIGH